MNVILDKICTAFIYIYLQDYGNIEFTITTWVTLRLEKIVQNAASSGQLADCFMTSDRLEYNTARAYRRMRTLTATKLY